MPKSTPKRTVQPDKPSREISWTRIIGIVTGVLGIVTAVLAVCAYYHTQQEKIWDGTLKQETAELTLVKQERDRVKEDLKACVERESKQLPRIQEPSVGAAGTVQVTAIKARTLNVGNLTIIVTELKFRPEPPGYLVDAKVSYYGSETLVRDAEEGAIITFPKEHGYDIKVVKADSVSAKFSIMKNP